MNSTQLSKTKLTIQILTNKKCQDVVELLESAIFMNSRIISVSMLEKELRISQSETSQRLARLRSIGLVNTNRVGKNIYYSLNTEKVTYFENILKQF
jgi:DNA-binding transcriptional ArsR family regulator